MSASRTARRVAAAGSAAALVVAATACGGSASDKAGGSEPLVLTLAAHDDDYAHGSFAAAVERLSGGSIRIDVVNHWRDPEPDYERGIVEDVRSGKAELGIVGVRVWDTLGVNGFRALVAPFLVDSLALERKALESPLASQAIAEVGRRGLVGIALLPGRLRRPFGVTRALVGQEDYRGATIGIRQGGVAAEAVRALGATPKVYVPGALSGADGAELDPATIVSDGYDGQATALTADVVLWPKAQTVVMHRKAFDSLTPDQREILRAAGREALAPELARIERDERAGFLALCRRGKLSLVTAGVADLSALRRAVQPVYDELERAPFTKKWIAEINGLREVGAAAGPRTFACARPGVETKSSESALEGRWKFTRATLNELVAEGVSRPLAEWLVRKGPRNPGIVFAHGRTDAIDLDTGRVLSTGTYEVEADIVRLVFETGRGVKFGTPYELRWSVYRNKLSFSGVAGSPSLQVYTIKPLTRVR